MHSSSNRARRGARIRRGTAVLAACAIAVTGLVSQGPSASTDTLAPGVSTQTIWSPSTPLTTSLGAPAEGLKGGAQGINKVVFGRTGDAVVAEKRGRLVWFSGTNARSGTVLTDERGHDVSEDTLAVQDTGMSGLALDPGWPYRPYLYVFYTANFKRPQDGGGRWTASECPKYGSCTVDARIQRITIGQRWVNGKRTPYLAKRQSIVSSGWCTEASAHPVGDLVFGPDGALYASAGDNARNGQTSPQQSANCADVVTDKYPSRMATLDALDPTVKTSLIGKIIRINPANGAPVPGNPYYRSRDVNRARMIGMGFRNPYRMAFKPGTATLAVSSIGEARTEALYEFDIRRALHRPVNSGWPCYEVNDVFETGPLCQGLSPTNGTLLRPRLSYQHGERLTATETCKADGLIALMGVAYPRRGMPAGAGRSPLVLNDYGRGCMWYLDRQGKAQFLGDFGVHNIRSVATGADGYLYFPDYQKGEVRRLTATGV